MSKRSIIHMLNPMKQNSPFDINMALDAGYDILMPYNNVELKEVAGLTQDAIFSRGPAGVKKNRYVYWGQRYWSGHGYARSGKISYGATV